MPSNAQRGASAKARTKRYLERHGYAVADMELVRIVYTPRGMLPTKRDQLGADVMGVDASQVVLVQVKSGKAASVGTFPDARRKFAQFRCPPSVRRLVMAWPPRAREPRIVDGVTGLATTLAG